MDEPNNIYNSIEDCSTLPETYIVIRISSKIESKTLEWLVEKIRGKRSDGGAELILMKQPYTSGEEIVLHVSISQIKLLEVAEEMEIIKTDNRGTLREFSVQELEDFLADDMHVEDLFTTTEKQSMVRHELENIRALTNEKFLPEYPSYVLYEGQSILQVYIKWNLVNQIYPLHDAENLKKLSTSWYLAKFKKQPIESIRAYFGEAVALYFSFLDYYTLALLVPMTLGFLQILLSTDSFPFYCVFNVVWATIFLEMWRRKSNELAFGWGTIGMTSQSDEPRPNFHGHMGTDKVTGRYCPQFPRWKTNIRMYGVSLPIVIVCLIAAFILMLFEFWVEDEVKLLYPDSWVTNIPSIVYTLVVNIVNLYYRSLATFLTEWENHRTQSQYDRHRVSKLVLFEFVNNFMSLFYIAFIIQDMDMLRSQLRNMLITTQILNNLQETILPYMLNKYRCLTSKTSKKIYKQGKELYDLLNIPEIHEHDSRIEAANRESAMEVYEGTYDDYLEMFIQFGFVLLFTPVYPIAAMWAVINNLFEIKSDAIKLCLFYQRPFTKRVKDIGAWQRAFEILGALAIMTNCGLLCLSPKLKQFWPDLSYTEWIMIFVVLEHLLIGIRYVLHIAIPDKPEWVRVSLAKRNYELKQALKFERFQRNRRLLTRRFKTVHGAHGKIERKID